NGPHRPQKRMACASTPLCSLSILRPASAGRHHAVRETGFVAAVLLGFLRPIFQLAADILFVEADRAAFRDFRGDDPGLIPSQDGRVGDTDALAEGARAEQWVAHFPPPFTRVSKARALTK